MADSTELEKLGELHRQGVLTDDEFQRAKARVLNGIASAQAAAQAQEAPLVRALNGLRRGREDRWLGGVCSGIARAMGMAPWVWRLFFTGLVLCAGTGVLVYLLFWIFVPLEPLRAGAGQMAA